MIDLSTGPGKRPYLIEFDYDHYCQGYERGHTSVLVYAGSYDAAVQRIKADSDYRKPRTFKSRTIL
jgi:hypothetical protein